MVAKEAARVREAHTQLKTVWSELLAPCPHAVALLLPEIDKQGNASCGLCDIKRDRMLLLTLVDRALVELTALKGRLEAADGEGNTAATQRSAARAG